MRAENQQSRPILSLIAKVSFSGRAATPSSPAKQSEVSSSARPDSRAGFKVTNAFWALKSPPFPQNLRSEYIVYCTLFYSQLKLGSGRL